MICKKYLYPRGVNIKFIESDTANAHGSATEIVYNGVTVLSYDNDIYTVGLSYGADWKTVTFDNTWVGRTVTFHDNDNDYQDKTFVVPAVDTDITIYPIGLFMSAALKWADGKPTPCQDLDSHLVVFDEQDSHNRKAHSYYSNKTAYVTNTETSKTKITLDVDDSVSSYLHNDVNYAMETSAIYVEKGTWDNTRYTTKYYIYNYNNVETIPSRNARVEVSLTNGTSLTVSSANATGSGRWWLVFTYDGNYDSTTQSYIHIVNQLTDTEPEGVNGEGSNSGS